MGIINWMQNRLSTAKQDKRRTEATAAAAVASSARRRGGGGGESCRQEEARDEIKIAGDHLLSIGTLGNESPPPPATAAEEVADFTIEEVKKLQEALNKLLRRAKSTKQSGGSRRGSTAAEHDADERSSSSSGGQLLLPLDRFLNCPSSLEVDRRVAAADGEFSPDTQIILSKARDLLINTNGGGAIKHKSFRFLLKKMFVCRGGFSPSPAPPPTLKDPVESRIEKLFRTMLHKRMNARPSNAAASSSRKYYLEDKPREKMQREHLHDDEDDDENGEDIFKWDKTDSDFIVLEM
uniref:NGR2 n=1 Tax=Oryza meridionalis TaxID=40149 RepID=A0A0E0EEA9_9ORYZ